jgi:Tol biopolymer transport system component
MAPEQIEGLEADARTDIFAFGALVFEMVTGRTAFEGKTRASLLGAILKDDPPRVSTAQPVAPAALDRIAATCLAKDPDDRYQSARDLLRDLKWVSSGVATTSEAAAPRHARGTIAARWAAAAALGVALITVGAMLARIWLPAPARSTDSVQFTIPPPADTTFATPPGGGTGVAAQLAISPDGRRVVFVGSTQNRFQLWLRSIGSIDARAIPGTDDAIFPFWSPDSQSIGFFANGKLKKVGVAGGPSTVLCDALAGRGGTWNRDNVIVFSPATTGPLMRVSGAGGVPQPAGALDAASSESSQRFPWFLPDGRHFLFTGVVGTCCPAAKPGHIRVGALDSTEAATVLEADSAAVYSDGHLLFAREGTLMAAAFDTSARRFTGDPFPVAELVATEGSRYVSVSASTTGVLVYARAASRQTMRLTWVDRAGRRLGVSGEPATYVNVALSRNERRIAAAILVTRTDSRDVWILDASRGEPSRLTFEAGVSVAPVWSPDDQQIAFAANRNGRPGLRLKRVTGMTQEETLLTSENGGSLTPTHWTADGKYIIFTRTQGTGGSNDIWALPLDGDRKPFAVVATPAVETNGVISPNGRWIAYQSPETAAQTQVLVQPFPPTGGKFQISTAGGFHPVWSTDGKELYFISPDAHMMAVAVKASDSFEHGAPVPLFTLSTTAALGGIGRQFDVTKDGRFLINVLQQESSSLPLTVTLNGMAAIQR